MSDVRDASSKILQLVQSAAIFSVLAVAERSGLLASMAKAGPLTAPQLATKSNLQERYIVEILSTLTTAEIVQFDSSKHTWVLPDSFSQCLVDETSPFNLSGWTRMIPILYGIIPKVEHSVRHGGGVPYEDYDPDFVCGMERLNGPSFKSLLARKWLPSIPGLADKLKAGIRVADLGCGTGVSTITMAKAYPQSQFFGYDISVPAIERAQALAKAEGVTNVTFLAKNATEFETSPGFDFILTFDVIHDLTRPLEVLAAIYQSLRPGGVYLMVEPKAANSLEENLENPAAGLLYSISTMHCMTTCLSGGGPGYGAMMGPAKAEELCRQVGFTSFKRSNIQNLTNAFFEVRKEPSANL